MVDLKFWYILKNSGQSSTPNSTTMSENIRTETLSLNYRIEEVNSRGNISNLYSEGAEFESQLGMQLSWPRFQWFPSRPPGKCQDGVFSRSRLLPSKTFSIHFSQNTPPLNTTQSIKGQVITQTPNPPKSHQWLARTEFLTLPNTRGIRGSHSSNYEHYCLLGCATVQFGRYVSVCYRNLLFPSSGWKSESSTIKMEVAGYPLQNNTASHYRRL